MGVFRAAIQKSSHDLGHSLGGVSSDGTAVSTLFGTGGAQINVLKEYNGYAWKLINIRATTLSQEDIFVEKIVGDRTQQDINHPFNEVLEGDNGKLDLSELLEAHSQSLDLYGIIL